jgi:hypothetical protein
VLGVVRQREIHTAERLVPEPRAFEFYMAIENIKGHKSPGMDQIPAEFRQGAEQFALRSINLIILFESRGIV